MLPLTLSLAAAADHALLAKAVDEPEATSDSERLVSFVVYGARSGAVSARCGEAIAVAVLGAGDNARVSEAFAACDLPCPKARLVAMDLPYDQRSTAVAASCAGVPDPVFGGSLAPLRDGSDGVRVLLTRALYEAIAHALPAKDPLSQHLADLRPALALTLDEDWRGTDSPLVTARHYGDARRPVSVGAIDADGVASALAAHTNELRVCATPVPPKPLTEQELSLFGYQQPPVFAASPPPDRLLVTTEHAPDGRVLRASARGVTEACLAPIIASARFPAPTDGQSAIVVSPILLADVEPEFPTIHHGAITREQLDTVVHAHDAELQACAVSTNLNAGTYAAELEIDPKGKLAEVKLYDFPAYDPTCFYTLFQRMTFPAPGGAGATVTYRVRIPR